MVYFVLGMALFWKRKDLGQGLVEYALVIVGVAILVLLIILTMGNQLQNIFSNVITSFTSTG